jgi:hypothetical protein
VFSRRRFTLAEIRWPVPVGWTRDDRLGEGEPPGHLPVARAGLDQLRRSQPHLLTTGPFRSGQPAAIGVPHGSGIAHGPARLLGEDVALTGGQDQWPWRTGATRFTFRGKATLILRWNGARWSRN